MKANFATAAVMAALATVGVAAPAPDSQGWRGGNGVSHDGYANYPFQFTSTYTVVATPDQVINGTTPTPGEPGAVGLYKYGINSYLNVICYNITLTGVTGDYRSPAITATHIHEAVKGATGPPRIAFPNPGPVTDNPATVRRSVGCLTGPFVTGVINTTTGLDQGAGFTVSRIEANPAGFFTDAHTVKYTAGVVRGQLA